MATTPGYVLARPIRSDRRAFIFPYHKAPAHERWPNEEGQADQTPVYQNDQAAIPGLHTRRFF